MRKRDQNQRLSRLLTLLAASTSFTFTHLVMVAVCVWGGGVIAVALPQLIQIAANCSLAVVTSKLIK